jgi:flagellar hook assembly protein FlgD
MLYLAYVPPTLGVDDGGAVPKSFTLSQNYPNPFNAQTNIEFELEKASRVELTVYDVTGAKVATLLKGERPAGKNQVNWDANAISSGVYYYTLRADGSEVTKKMTLLK